MNKLKMSFGCRAFCSIVAIGLAVLRPVVLMAEEYSPLDSQRMALRSYDSELRSCLKKFSYGETLAACAKAADDAVLFDLRQIWGKSKLSMLEDASFHGYAAIGKTVALDDHFTGCSIGPMIRLEDGDVLLCERGSPSGNCPWPAVKNPVAIIMRNVNGSTALLVNKCFIEGTLIGR